MAKTNTPFLSLGSRGTVGAALTSQSRDSLTVFRSKPIPAYRRTLPQQYQRWLYQDYAYLWTQQSAATKQSYATQGTPFHLTGFQYWMKVMLATMPDIAAWWTLDEKAGTVLYDRSRNANHGVIIGPSPASGYIDGKYTFDGLNDRVQIPVSASLSNFTAKTVEFLFTPTAFTGSYRVIFDFGFLNAPYGDQLWMYKTNNGLQLRLKNPAATVIALAPFSTPGLETHYLYTWDGVNASVFLNGVLSAGPTAFAGPLACTQAIHYLGCRPFALWYDCDLDNFIIYNRTLDQTEITRHSERRYP